MEHKMTMAVSMAYIPKPQSWSKFLENNPENKATAFLKS
jgi:hypothetical protein